MNNFILFLLVIVLAALLFTFNDGLLDKTKAFFGNILEIIHIDIPDTVGTIPKDATFTTYTPANCGFSAKLPDTYAVINNTQCTGVLNEAQPVLSIATTNVCASLAKDGKSTDSCQIHTFEVANGSLEIVGENPKAMKLDDLSGIKTTMETDTTVTYTVVATADDGRTYRYTHQAPSNQKITAKQDFETIAKTFVHTANTL